MTAAPLRDRLPAIEPARASHQSAVVEALNRRRVGTLALSAELATADAAQVWIALDAGGRMLHVAPLLAGGAVASLADPAGRPDVAAAAAALGTVEPVIAAVELVTGRPLRPAELVSRLPDDRAIVRIEARENGRAVHRLLLAVAADTPLAADALALDIGAFADVAPSWTARIAAPAVAPARLARIAGGDLLLLGTPLGLARFTPPGRDTTLAGRLDITGGSMVLEHDLGPQEDGGTTADPAGIDVPLVIEIDGGGLTLERLAGLGVGSVVALPGARGGTLPARLVAGGKAVATGDLVAVGDGYGLLVTATLPAEG